MREPLTYAIAHGAAGTALEAALAAIMSAG